MSFRKAQNVVRIEGILSENNINYTSFTSKSTGAPVEAISGTIKVLVQQEVNGKSIDNEVPVHMFAMKYTNDGRINPAYESIEKVKNEFVSIAAAGSINHADKVRITKGEIRMNEFPGQNGIVSQPRIHTSFVSRAIGDFKPEASFSLEFMVSSIKREVDADGIECDPPRLNIQVIVPQYTAPSASAMNVDLVPLTVTAPNVINAIESYWEAGYCYKASGRLNFSSKTEEVYEEVDFGEAQRVVHTTNVSEFIVTGGTQVPLEGDFAFDMNDIKAGMAARKQRLEDLKGGKGTGKLAPAQFTAKKAQDLGF